MFIALVLARASTANLVGHHMNTYGLRPVLYTGQVTTVVRGAVRLHIYDWQSQSKGMV
jgi:hypothetical protein